MTALPVGGPAATTYRVTSRAHVTGRVAVPAYLVTDGRAVEGGPSQQVYYVSDAEIAAGEFIVSGDVHPIPIVAVNNVNAEYPPIPIYVVNQAQSIPTPLQATLLDLFTGANGDPLAARAPTKAPIGSAWSVEYGTFDIQSNAARMITVDGSKKYGAALVESSKADSTFATVMYIAASGGDYEGGGLVFRASDKLNFFAAAFLSGGLYILKIENGSLSVLTTALYNDDATVEHILEVTTSGQNITAKADGGRTTISTTSTFNQTATKAGVIAWRPGNTFDLFEVV